MASEELVTPEIPDQGRVYDEDLAEWDSGWQTCFKRHKVVTFLDAILFNDVIGSATSELFKCAPYRFAEICFDVVKSGEPTNVLYYIETSPDGVAWFVASSSIWSGHSSTATGKISLIDRIISPYFRVRADATNVTALNTFLVSVKVVFSG
jgi:hypothetical protein